MSLFQVKIEIHRELLNKERTLNTMSRVNTTYPVCLKFCLYPHPFEDNTTLLEFPIDQKQSIERGIREDFVSILRHSTFFELVITDIRWTNEEIIVDGLLSDNRLSDDEDDLKFWLEVISDKIISHHEAMHKGISYMLFNVQKKKLSKK